MMSPKAKPVPASRQGRLLSDWAFVFRAKHEPPSPGVTPSGPDLPICTIGAKVGVIGGLAEQHEIEHQNPAKHESRHPISGNSR
jgi:hypothetical protein